MNDCKLSKESIGFIVAARNLANRDNLFSPATNKTMTKLVIQLDERLQDKKNRKVWLRMVTGLPITSQKQLTHQSQSAIIGLIESGKYDEQVREIEDYITSYIEEHPGIDAKDIFTRFVQECLPDMFKAHNK
jgi:hypothetical protein